MAFTHLHLHTDYSLLDSMIKIPGLVKKIKRLGMTSCAITDHGTAAGIVEFYNACKKEGIKPVLGIEAYEAPGKRTDKAVEENPDNYYHLILLIKNEQGYKNLCKLVTRSNTEGFYYKPRIDRELLEIFHDGLICTTACIAGRAQQAIIRGDYKQAEQDVLWYKNLFGDDFYLEIQNHGIPEEKAVAQEFINLSKRHGIKLVCTNDCHYLDSKDAEAHEWMLCIQTGKKMADIDRMKYEGDYSVKSEEEMRQLFPYLPEAFDNTQEIVDKCDFDFVFGEYKMPKVNIPEEFYSSSDESPYYRYLSHLAFKGLDKRYPADNPMREEAIERLKYELSIIKGMNYAEYFLDTLKTIIWAKNNDVLVGPGRGSAAGSVMCYCLGITDIEPLKYGLLFERFLNPERVSMPDIDVDYNYSHKDEVVKSEADSNGLDHFAKIQTFMTMAAKGVIRDCVRVAGYEPAVGNNFSKMIGNEPSLRDAYSHNPEIEEYLKTDPSIRKLWNIALLLEGLKKSSSTHACGHIPTYDKCEDRFPCSVDKATGYLVCQYDMVEAEHLGNLKKDLLMLRNLDVIEVAHKAIKERYGIDIPLWTDDILNDKKALALFSNGDTNGVFQFESTGMKKFMKELKPDCFEDVIAGVSLYRPGPMDFIPQYIEGKHNPSSIHYLTSELEPILKNTYGCIVYQEQVMQIVRELAGFSMGRADKVRKGMGKKIQEIMDEEGQNFIYGNKELGIPGCINNGIIEEVAQTLWNQMAEFAKYAFNKSHAACYAAIAMQTAYLKANYPTEFYAGLLSSVMDKTDMLANYLIECKKKNVEVMPPDINMSEMSFKVIGDNKISFGLLSLKGLGKDKVNTIVDERKNGDYAGLSDFVKRTQLKKGVAEPLIYSGAFDRFGFTRRTLIANLENIIVQDKNDKKRQIEGQLDIFSLLDGDDAVKRDCFDELDEYQQEDLLSAEKEYCGVYISGHPLYKYSDLIATFKYSEKDISGGDDDNGDDDNEEHDYIADGTEVEVCGIIKNIKYHSTKKNETMIFMDIEGLTNDISVTVFPSVYKQYRELFVEKNIIVVKGTLSINPNFGNSILAQEIIEPDTIPYKLWIRFPSEDALMADWENIKARFYNDKAPKNIVCYILDTKKQLRPDNLHFNLSQKILREIKDMYGDDNVVVAYQKTQKNTASK